MRRIRTAILLVVSALSGASFAGTPPAQTHHCKMPDGTIDPKKTHKQCQAAKGTWAKDEPNAPKGSPGTAAPSPSPSPPTAPSK